MRLNSKIDDFKSSIIHHQSASARPGLSRLDVVLLLVIALVVVSLLITFINRQRELADQKTCANNLRRIGEAVLGFHEEKSFLPAARIAPGYATWGVMIAPHLQNDSGLLEWDLAKRYADQSAKARTALLTPYFCPARPRSEWVSPGAAGPDQDPVPGALGDYACCCGDGDPQKPWTGPSANGAIILGEVLEEKDALVLRWQGRTNLAALVRGQSYTLMVGEKHVPLDQLGQSKAGDGSFYDGALAASSGRVGGPGFGIAESPLAPFNTNFGSAHAGICQFLHADGSAHAYANSMSPELLGKLIRRE